MNILAFDTTLSMCSIAVMAKGMVRAVRIETEPAKQVERLFPMIEEALAEAGIAYADLDALAVTTGPGSFTGVRIGIAAARGLRLATGLPVIGLSGFEVINRAISRTRHNSKLLVVLDARRQQVFAQAFDSAGEVLAEPVMLAYAEIVAYAGDGALLLAGNGKHLVAPYLPHAVLASDEYDAPGAVTLAEAAAYYIKIRPQGDDLAPLYIRPPDAKIAVKK
jgi:tRNA threonylcarbamoyladenosine biosynthesis protein TsaB